MPTRSRVRALSLAVLIAALPLSLQAQATTGDTPPAALPSVTLPPALDRVLRDYEKHWAANKLAELSNLFTADGFVMQNGKMPVRGREAIAAVYADGAGGQLQLRAFAFATSNTVGYILGGYTYGDAKSDMGKFTLTLRRTRRGRWMIASDMDNSNGARKP